MLEIAVQRRNPPCEAEARVGWPRSQRSGRLESADAEARRVVELTETFREAAVSLDLALAWLRRPRACLRARD